MVQTCFFFHRYIFHHYFRNGLCYLIMCPRTVNLRIPYLFLEDVADLVTSLFSSHTLQNALALSLNSQLAPVLQERMVSPERRGCSNKVTQFKSLRVPMHVCDPIHVPISCPFYCSTIDALEPRPRRRQSS